MPSEAPPPAPSPIAGALPGPVSRPDWAATTAKRIEELVDTVRENTVDRLVSVVRILVLGVVAAVLGLAAAVLGLVAAIRVLDIWVPRGVWLPYTLLGAIFSVAGLFLWSKRTAR